MDCNYYQSEREGADFWFQAKTHLIDGLMKKASGKKRETKILSIGPGIGEELAVLKKYGETYALDINQQTLNLIDASVCQEKKLGDAQNLPYENNFFDIVCAFDVFEHIADDERALAEIKRVLKSEGALVFTVPAGPGLFSAHDQALGHKRRYNKKMLQQLLTNFYGQRLIYWNSLLFIPIALLRLSRRKQAPRIDCFKLPRLINWLLFSILGSESYIIERGFRFPWGLSLVGYCRKKD